MVEISNLEIESLEPEESSISIKGKVLSVHPATEVVIITEGREVVRKLVYGFVDKSVLGREVEYVEETTFRAHDGTHIQKLKDQFNGSIYTGRMDVPI